MSLKVKQNVYILWNNQQMQLYAVNFIPLLGSLYMFRVPYTPIIRSTIFNCGLQATLGVSSWDDTMFVPVAVDTIKNFTPDDGCIKHPKHVEWP